jgi:hypothetical protein
MALSTKARAVALRRNVETWPEFVSDDPTEPESRSNGMRMMLLAGIGLIALVTQASAQDTPSKSSLGLRLGGSVYRLEDSTTTGQIGALVFTVPVHRVIVFEGSLPILDDDRSVEIAGLPAAKRISALLPEISIQAQLPLGRVLPYVGGGGGGAIKIDGPGSSGFSAHVAGGVRVIVAKRFNIQADVRRRWTSKWAKWMMDYTIGLNWSR